MGSISEQKPRSSEGFPVASLTLAERRAITKELLLSKGSFRKVMQDHLGKQGIIEKRGVYVESFRLDETPGVIHYRNFVHVSEAKIAKEKGE